QFPRFPRALCGLERRAALAADPALLLTFVVLVTRAARGRALAAPERDVGHLERAFLLEDPAARVALGGLGVAIDRVHALDHHAPVVREQAQHATALALLLARDDDHLITLAYVHVREPPGPAR